MYCIILELKKNLTVKILKKIKLKSKLILIKDHFETGFFSRTILRFMNFIGNYYNNFNVPQKYFRKKEFLELINSAKLKAKMSNLVFTRKFIFFIS